MQKIPPNAQANKLTMTKCDVQIAIARTFRSEFNTISFVGDVNPIGISEDAHSVRFTIQDEFKGAGIYEVHGTAKLIVNVGYLQSHMLYNVSGKVTVAECDGSPEVAFNDPISIKRK